MTFSLKNDSYKQSNKIFKMTEKYRQIYSLMLHKKALHISSPKEFSNSESLASQNGNITQKQIPLSFMLSDVKSKKYLSMFYLEFFFNQKHSECNFSCFSKVVQRFKKVDINQTNKRLMCF